jgi:hypothetical protein
MYDRKKTLHEIAEDLAARLSSPEPSRTQQSRKVRQSVQQAAQSLAALGRGEDRQIAHVTRGEAIVPRQLQTPEVLTALRNAARAEGVNLASLFVGDPANSINPQTGRPEFAYRPEVQSADAARPRLGTEVADLYISHFPEAASGFGHVGIGVNSRATEGFYPARNGGLSASGYCPPGVVKSDDMRAADGVVVVPTSPDQDSAVQSYIDSRKTNPGDYCLYSRNCTNFVGDAMRAGGVNVPTDVTPDKIDDESPHRFYDALQRKYGGRNQ